MMSIPHTWIEISKQALEHNFKMYKQFIGDKLLGVVVKSNAYGHGILEVPVLPKKVSMWIGFLLPPFLRLCFCVLTEFLSRFW